VSPISEEASPIARRRWIIATGLTAAIVVAAVILIHGPSVGLALTGDSYQWVQHAHRATHQARLLLADLDTFLRPSTTWTLAVDRALWGGFDARGLRTGSLAIHCLAALLLAVAGRRLGLGAATSGAVALLWATSAFTDESAFVVAYRFEPLLLIAWLALVAVWPTGGERWSVGRAAAAVAATLAAAAAKETWVVTPALVLALELDRRRPLGAALRPALVAGAAALVYVVGYFLAFPGSKSYYELGPHVVAKLPGQLAAFLFLAEPMPFALALGWTGVLATAAVAALAAVCLRRRVRGAWTALALLVLPTLPTILVPFMPQRYLAIPYAGFLLLAALALESVAAQLPRWRRALVGGGALVAATVIAAGAATVRADLADYRRVAAAHQALLEEAAEVAGVVASGGPVAVVRDETAQPLLDILRAPQGLAKLPFTRHADPYGLVDAAALFEWVIADEGTRVEPLASDPAALAGVSGPLLVHRLGAFEVRGEAPDLGAEVVGWQTDGRRFRLIRTVELR
jgi:hypothetical protein